MRCCTTSTKAATSWSVTRSRSSTAATKAASTTGAADRQAMASGAGTTPSADQASVARSSISNQRPKRAMSEKTAAISGSS